MSSKVRLEVLLKMGIALTIVFLANPVYSCTIDVAFVIDNSGSVEYTNWNIMISFIKNVVRLLNIDSTSTRVAAVDFGDYGRLNFNLSRWSTQNEVLAAIENITYLGQSTNTTDGLRVARQLVFNPSYGDRPGVPNVLILLTDQDSNSESNSLSEEVNTIKGLRITIIVILVASSVGGQFLRSIVTPPSDDNYFNVTTFSQLTASTAKLLKSACQVAQSTTSGTSTLTDYTSTSATRSITTIAPSTATSIISTTMETTMTTVASCTLDVAFVMDNTGSIGYGNWNFTIGFIKNVVRRLNIDSTSTRVAAVDFGDSVRLNFNLSRWTTSNEVLAAIDRLPFLSENTDTPAEGLRVTRQSVFSQSSGDRPNVPNVLILFNDGGKGSPESAVSAQANMTKAMGITIIAVVVTSSIDVDLERFWRKIVTPPSDDNYFQATAFSQLNPSTEKLLKSACQVAQSTTSGGFKQEDTASTPTSTDQTTLEITQPTSNERTEGSDSSSTPTSSVTDYRTRETSACSKGESGGVVEAISVLYYL